MSSFEPGETLQKGWSKAVGVACHLYADRGAPVVEERVGKSSAQENTEMVA